MLLSLPMLLLPLLLTLVLPATMLLMILLNKLITSSLPSRRFLSSLPVVPEPSSQSLKLFAEQKKCWSRQIQNQKRRWQ